MKYWRPVVLAAVSLQVVALLFPATAAETASSASSSSSEDLAARQSGGEGDSRTPHLVIKRAPGWGKRAGLPRVTLLDEVDEGDDDEDLYPEDGPVDKREPGWGKRAPGWGKRAPGWGKRAPGWGKRVAQLPRVTETAWAKRAPGWGKRGAAFQYPSLTESGLGKRAPGWGKRAPGWGKRAPGWGKRAPGWGKRSATTCEDLDEEINYFMDQAMKAEAEKLATCGNGPSGNELQRK